jgi:hypothetical protein
MKVKRKVRMDMEDRFGMVKVGGVVIYNTTPHVIRVLDEQGETLLEIPGAKQPLRLPEVVELDEHIGRIPVFRKHVVDGVAPIPFMNTFYVVSLPVAQTVKRSDFLVPHELVRDEAGNVIGCRGFAYICE